MWLLHRLYKQTEDVCIVHILSNSKFWILLWRILCFKSFVKAFVERPLGKVFAPLTDGENSEHTGLFYRFLMVDVVSIMLDSIKKQENDCERRQRIKMLLYCKVPVRALHNVTSLLYCYGTLHGLWFFFCKNKKTKTMLLIYRG